MRYIYGSISSGTLRTVDLLRAFADTLETLLHRENHTGNSAALGELIAEARAVDISEEGESVDDIEHAAAILSELDMALNEYAAPDHYFGAHPGDGADFGFWKNEECD